MVLQLWISIIIGFAFAQSPTITSPTVGQTIATEKGFAKLEWTSIEGAEKYVVKIVDSNDVVLFTGEFKENSAVVELPAGKDFKAHVRAVKGNALLDYSAPITFNVSGNKLAKPEITQREDENLDEIEWAQVKNATKYTYKLENKKGKIWKVVDQNQSADTFRKYESPLEGGAYRVTIIAEGDNNPPSDPTVEVFRARKVERTASEIAQFRNESGFESRTNHFLNLSWMASELTYSGTEVDNRAAGTQNPFPAQGGTGAIGYGMWKRRDSKIGIYSALELSGFNLDTKTGGVSQYTYLGSFDFMYRTRIGSLGKLRLFAGPQIRSFVVTRGLTADTTGKSFELRSLQTLGPEFGFKYSYGLNRNMGLNVLSKISYATLGLIVPKGDSVKGTLSYQAGLLGSLRLAHDVVGLAGVTYRKEALDYSSGLSGRDESASTTGVHLHLMLEYGF